MTSKPRDLEINRKSAISDAARIRVEVQHKVAESKMPESNSC